MIARQWFGGSLRRDLTSDATLKPRAAKLQVYNATGATRTLTLESATLYQPGKDLVVVANEGDESINVRDADAGLVVTVAAGNAAKISLADNSTDAGDWTSSTWTFSAEAQVAYNFVGLMLDDVSRSACSWYDDLNRWPGSYPYANTPHLTNDVKPRALRFTQFRGIPRCSPKRAAVYSGRLGHRTSVHPDGTGVGDVPGQTPNSQLPYFEGLQAIHNPWPRVAKDSGAPHSMALFGKYHLFNYNAPELPVTERNPVDIAGFDESHRFELSGGGAPLYGYYNYEYHYVTASSVTTTQDGVDFGPTFSPALLYEKATTWIESQIAQGKPFACIIDHNLPHGNWPAIPQEHQLTDPSGTNTRTLHTTYTQDELVPDADGNNGETAEGGWNAAGQSYESQNGGAPYVFTDQLSEPYLSYPYGPEGQIHLIHRRMIALMECADSLVKWIEHYVETNHPEAYANTVWMHYSDNGSEDVTMQPLTTTEHAALGANYANVIPPTSDGTVNGTEFHFNADAKGTTKDEGILTPFMVWGPIIPGGLEGTDCDRYVDSTDLYPTILDLLAPNSWRAQLGSDLSKVDGETFFDSFATGAGTSKPYTYHGRFYPGWVASTRQEVFEYDFAVVGTPSSTYAEGWKLRRLYEKTYPGGPITLTKVYELYDTVNDPDESNDQRAAAQAEVVGGVGTTDRSRALLELIDAYNAKFGI